MDADWHAFCQAISRGIEGSEWEELYFHSEKRVRQELGNQGKPSESQKGNGLVGHQGSQRQRGGIL